MRFRFILSETWNSLKRNVSMIISVMLVTFISFLFIGVSGLMQAQITAAKGEWYDKVEVVVWLCPDGASQAASCSSGKAPSNQEIVDLENVINEEAGNIVSKITYVSREDFYKNTFLKQYPNGEYQGRVLTAADMQGSLRLKLKDPTKYQVVSEVLSGRTGVEEVQDQRKIFDPVFSVLNRATAVTVALAGVMILVAIMLTGTTIRMSAASRKERDRDHATGGSLELDHPPAVRVGRRVRVADWFAARLRNVERHGEAVHHGLAVEERAVDASDQPEDGMAACTGPCGGSRRAVDRRVQHLAEEVPEGINRRSAERDVQHI